MKLFNIPKPQFNWDLNNSLFDIPKLYSFNIINIKINNDDIDNFYKELSINKIQIYDYNELSCSMTFNNKTTIIDNCSIYMFKVSCINNCEKLLNDICKKYSK